MNTIGETRPITITPSIQAEAKRLAAQEPVVLTEQDKQAFVEGVPDQFREEAEEHWDEMQEHNELMARQKELDVVRETRDMVSRLLTLSKPLLTIPEAAELLGVSRKRLENILCEERARLGKTPDFVCDAGGRMQRRVLRDALLDWVKGNKKRTKKVAA